ncbi:hypothetical protein B0J13DRAFT_527873 [Dactylonectria estremocensis]|uniref:Uncharacterized protein n=1 Tax=Dactylonectria estremocensis TaxID=1079267 RepID=A0A9P9EGH7_9HYPO|nr:hypothetical protein B0J13DRAFT_527873 [Dactylonectria estremocensis]
MKYNPNDAGDDSAANYMIVVGPTASERLYITGVVNAMVVITCTRGGGHLHASEHGVALKKMKHQQPHPVARSPHTWHTHPSCTVPSIQSGTGSQVPGVTGTSGMVMGHGRRIRRVATRPARRIGTSWVVVAETGDGAFVWPQAFFLDWRCWQSWLGLVSGRAETRARPSLGTQRESRSSHPSNPFEPSNSHPADWIGYGAPSINRLAKGPGGRERPGVIMHSSEPADVGEGPQSASATGGNERSGTTRERGCWGRPFSTPLATTPVSLSDPAGDVSSSVPASDFDGFLDHPSTTTEAKRPHLMTQHDSSMPISRAEKSTFSDML